MEISEKNEKDKGSIPLVGKKKSHPKSIFLFNLPPPPDSETTRYASHFPFPQPVAPSKPNLNTTLLAFIK
jgi:hypothetical protein